MASQDPDCVLLESDADKVTEDLTQAKAAVQRAGDAKWNSAVVWHTTIYFSVLYPAGLYGAYLFLLSAKWQTNIFAGFLYVVTILGITAGVHRLWSHRSYKAKWPLELILMIFQTSSLQYSVINWVRDHRMHHKFVDTDADPHNATRGLFFSHISWACMEKRPEYERKVKGLDLSDIESNPILRFQQKYYFLLVGLICIIIPNVVPVYCWNETWTNAFFVPFCFRLTLAYNATQLVNSAAHKWGYKSYDKHMLATELIPLSPFMLGEFYHNYHHAFPWDYKAAEMGGSALNFTAMFIEFFAKLGWAYDLKTVSKEVIRKRVMRTGDGSHPIWGWGDKDQPKEEMAAAIRINPNDGSHPIWGWGDKDQPKEEMVAAIIINSKDE